MKLSPPPPPDSQTSDVHRMHIDIDAAASPSTTGLKPAKDNNNNKDRSSLSGRPLRKAAEKVHSYKEIPLNTKMRRKDHWFILNIFTITFPFCYCTFFNQSKPLLEHACFLWISVREERERERKSTCVSICMYLYLYLCASFLFGDMYVWWVYLLTGDFHDHNWNIWFDSKKSINILLIKRVDSFSFSTLLLLLLKPTT